MPNTEIIDSVVSPDAVKQVQDLQAASADLQSQFIDTAKAAAQLLAITGKANSVRELTKAQRDLALATERVTQAQAKSAQAQSNAAKAAAQATQAQNNEARSALQLQQALDKQTQAQNKAAQAAQKALSPYEQLNKQHIELRNNARDVGVQFGLQSEEFKKAQKEANGLDGQLKAIDSSLGQSQRNVGNYASGFSKLYGYVRVAANILPGIGISGIFLAAGEAIVYAANKLDIFNKLIYKLSTFDIKNLAFKEAFEGDGFKKAIENVQQLATNIDLAKNGIISQNKVVDEYNETIGSVTGRVDNFTAAQAGFVKNSDKYIAAILNEAAAQSILSASAKDFAEVAEKNNELRTTLIANSKLAQANRTGDFSKITQADNEAKSEFGIEGAKTQAELVEFYERKNRGIQKEIDENTKSLNQRYKNRASVLKEATKEIAAATGGASSTGAPASEASNVDKLNNQIANQQLELEKDKQQAIIDNEKLSYRERLAAVQAYAAADRQIQENNRKLNLIDTKLSNNEKLSIQNEYNKAIYDINTSADAKTRELNDKRQKEINEGRKKDLEAQKQSAKNIIDNPATSLDARLSALDDYRDKSRKIIDLTTKEQVENAGKNQYAINNINKEAAAQRLQVDIDYTQQSTKIFEDEYNKQIQLAQTHDKDLLDDIKTASAKRLQAISDTEERDLYLSAEARAKNSISEREYQKEIIAIQHKANLDRLNEQLNLAKNLLKLQQGSGADTADAENQIATLQRSINKENTDFKLNNFKTEAQEREDAARVEIELAEQTAKTVTSIINGAYQSRIDAINTQKQAIQDAADLEKAAVDRSLETQQNKVARQRVIDAQAKAEQDRLTREQNELKRKQAIYDRALAIAGIVEQTQLAAAKTLGETGFFGIPLTAIVYALGALQLATVLATPLPSYKVGTENHKGGPAKLHANEMVILPGGGGTFLTPDVHEMVYNLPKGTKVKTAEATRDLIRPEVLTEKRSTIYPVDMSPVVKAIERNKPTKPRNEDWRNIARREEFQAHKNRRFR